jgi:large subunit ribosomal protein L15
MPIHRRLPKRGFTNIFGSEYTVLNLTRLDKLEGTEFDPQSLLKSRAIRKLRDGLKILGTGEITRAITIKAHFFSQSALDKIKAAGGTAEVIPAFKRAQKSKEELKQEKKALKLSTKKTDGK